MRARSLTELELEALADLDASIRAHDTFVSDGKKSQTPSTAGSPSTFHRFSSLDLPSSTPRKPPETPVRIHRDRRGKNSIGKINAGYILYDGSEIQYIGSNESLAQSSEIKANKKPAGRKDSFNSSLANVSKLQATHGAGDDDLIRGDFLAQSGYSLSHLQRLPTYTHFSIRQKIYFFVIGMAILLSFNTFHLSLTYFSQSKLFGRAVLSSLGTSHYTSSAIAMLAVVLSKKKWRPFVPTIPLCLLLMACLVILIPALDLAQVSVPVIAMFALICCNGLFTGICQALIGGMVALFPGHKAIWLITAGIGFGSFIPALVQLILVLCLPTEWHTETRNRNATGKGYEADKLLSDNIYILSMASFVGILIGLFAVVRLHRSGIYKLFASKDSLKANPRNVGIYKDDKKIKTSLRRVRVYLLSEILVSAVSMYVLSLARYAHETTTKDTSAHNSEFWKFHLATIFLVVFKLGDCLGRVLGTILKCCPKISSSLKKTLFFGLAFLRLGFVVAAVLFVQDPFLLYYNLYTIIMYFILALTNGILSSAMMFQCLELCGVGGNSTGAVVLQITWFCIDLGNAIGAALSFVPLV